MSDLQKAILFALVLLAVLAIVVGAVLRYHIGGFIKTVAREAREQEMTRDEEARQARTEKEDTGV